MTVFRNITIIGTGQVGSILAYHFLRRGYYVDMIEAGNLLNRPNRQIPWGWWRTKTLQPKPRLHQPPLDIPFKPNQRYGPMLLTTTDNGKVECWKEWISRNQTNAHILNPEASIQKYDLPIGCFDDADLRKGGTLVCDSDDFIIDFDQLNKELYASFSDNPRCNIIDNFEVKKLTPTLEGVYIINKDGEKSILSRKVILACGNQNYKLINDYPPVLFARLPYMKAKLKNEPKYISLWNPNSSLTILDKDNVKIGCGGLHSLENLPINYSLYYLPMGLSMLLHRKTSYIKKPKELVNMTLQDLEKYKDMGLEVDHTTINSCVVDITPTMLPIVDFMTPNLLAIGGFSGSGFTAYEKWFGESVIEAIETGKLNDCLKPFRKRKLIEQWFPTQDEKSYVFR